MQEGTRWGGGGEAEGAHSPLLSRGVHADGAPSVIPCLKEGHIHPRNLRVHGRKAKQCETSLAQPLERSCFTKLIIYLDLFGFSFLRN